jgi:hypothetical protein
MSTETKARVKQIIMDCCGGGFSIATDILHEQFVIIHRDELPKASPNSEGNVEVEGVDHSVWPVSRATATRARRDALESLSAAEAIEANLPDPIDARRDELARNLVGDGGYAYRFAEAPLKLAIDTIIELEASK